MTKHGTLFILSAPSGTGKTTLVNELIKRMTSEHALERVVTYTSRAPRTGEQEGTDYCFVSKTEFEQKIKEGFFIEWSAVYDAYYGSPWSAQQRLQEGVSCILVIDRRGAQLVHEQLSCVTIWVEPPCLDTLKIRLERRAKDAPDVIAWRLEIAAQEMAQERANPWYEHQLINDEFETAVCELKKLVCRYILNEGE